MEGLPHDDEPVFADDLGSASSGHAGHADQIVLRAQDSRGQAEIDASAGRGSSGRSGDRRATIPDLRSRRRAMRCTTGSPPARDRGARAVPSRRRSAPPSAADARSATAARGPASRLSVETAPAVRRRGGFSRLPRFGLAALAIAHQLVTRRLGARHASAKRPVVEGQPHARGREHDHGGGKGQPLAPAPCLANGRCRPATHL